MLLPVTLSPAPLLLLHKRRLIMDRETGKPKGFGFCEFHSKEDAESAYRNLNNTLFKGRQIRIDFAEENMSDRMGYKGGGGGYKGESQLRCLTQGSVVDSASTQHGHAPQLQKHQQQHTAQSSKRVAAQR